MEDLYVLLEAATIYLNKANVWGAENTDAQRVDNAFKFARMFVDKNHETLLGLDKQ